MHLYMLGRLLSIGRAVLAALRGRLGALCWSLTPLSLSLPLSLPGWRRDSPARREREQEWDDASPTPTSVNYHFTRQCNYKCGFCFHTAKTSFVLPLEEAKRGLAMLKEAGMEKINFSGGEPFLQDRGEFVGKLVQFCKQELELPSVSIVSNGSLIRERWFKKYGEYLDILAISCDSFDEDVNILIGRGQGKKNHVENLHKLRQWCREYAVAFKINSVINRFNVEEDMNEQIKALNPVRWKVFQCLLIEGENSGEDALREAEKFVISDEDFERFLDRHRDVSCLVPESNQKMRDSYLILDEYMRFLNCRNGRKEPSKSILDVGVEAAIKFSGFDEQMFLTRGGKYVWSKADMKLDCCKDGEMKSLTGECILPVSQGKVDCSSSLDHKRASWQATGSTICLFRRGRYRRNKMELKMSKSSKSCKDIEDSFYEKVLSSYLLKKVKDFTSPLATTYN